MERKESPRCESETVRKNSKKKRGKGEGGVRRRGRENKDRGWSRMGCRWSQL